MAVAETVAPGLTVKTDADWLTYQPSGAVTVSVKPAGKQAVLSRFVTDTVYVAVPPAPIHGLVPGDKATSGAPRTHVWDPMSTLTCAPAALTEIGVMVTPASVSVYDQPTPSAGSCQDEVSGVKSSSMLVSPLATVARCP